MKRRIAMGLACVMLLATPAMAETADTAAAATAEVNVEKVAIPYEGDWTLIEGAPRHNFEIYLPTGWVEYDLNGEEKEAVEVSETEADEETVVEEGLYFSVGSEDGSQALDVEWITVAEPADAATLQAEYALTHEDAAVVNIGNVDFVQYTDAETDAIVLALPLENDLYTFTFMPASDEEYAALANEIIATIAVYDAQTGDMLGAEPVEEITEENAAADTEGDA